MSFAALKKRITNILNRMPNDAPLPKELTEAENDAVSMAILLTSAEIEEYIEKLIKELIKTSFLSWKHDQKITITLLSFLYNKHPAKDKETFQSMKDALFKDLNRNIQLSYENALQAIEDNHGLSEGNLENLLKMSGIDHSLLSTEKSILNSFTKKRGAIAHTSNKNSAVTKIVSSPSSVKTDIINVMSAIETLSQEILEIKKLLGSLTYIKSIYSKEAIQEAEEAALAKAEEERKAEEISAKAKKKEETALKDKEEKEKKAADRAKSLEALQIAVKEAQTAAEEAKAAAIEAIAANKA